MTMAAGRLAWIPILAVLALVLIGAGPSVGERRAATPVPAAEHPATEPPATEPPAATGPCEDNNAILVSAGGGAEGVVFRCVGGVPIPRQGPWSTSGCDGADDQDEAMLAVVTVDPWQPATACLVAAPVRAGIPGVASDAIPRGR
jgi:hypothetical protein